MDATIIPESAWVQAVFVVLFIVLVIALLNWFSKQQGKWQEFIRDRDSQWQAWMDKAECRTADQLKNIVEALEKLMKNLDEHDNRVDERINNIKSTRQRK